MWLLVGCAAPVLSDDQIVTLPDEPAVEPTVPVPDEPDPEPEEPDPEPVDTSVTPELVGDRWTFTGADTVLEIDPALGARVTRFAVGGVEVLTGASVNATNFGATFWTSPQSAWGWPPVEAIDSAPYTATLDGDTLVLTSGAAPLGDTTVTVEKRVSVDTTGVTLAYTVHNVGDAAVALAGWEVARVPTGGLTFFRKGTGMTSTVGSFPAEERGGVVWFDGAAPRDGDTKLIADGSGGWLAHVVDGVLFVEAFADIAARDQAPGEGEIELFAAEDYVELENQGALTTITPGEGVTHTVRWQARPVPEGVPVVVGSEALVTIVAELISGGGDGP
jgi:hypothetical protein